MIAHALREPEGWCDEQKVDSPYPRGRASSPVAAGALVLLQLALSFLARTNILSANRLQCS